MIKDKIGSYFGIPVTGNYNLFFSSMNESGKITARSLLDLMVLLIETIEGMENKEEPVSILDSLKKQEITPDLLDEINGEKK